MAERREPVTPRWRRAAPAGLGHACIALAAALAALPPPATAGDLGGGLALSSQLVDRGQAITPATPIVQGNLAWTSGGWALGLIAAARVRAPGGHFVEAAAQAARYWTLSGEWSMQAGLLYYTYPTRRRIFDRVETGLHWTYRDVLTFGLSAASTVHTDRQHWREAADATLRWPLTRHLSLSAGAGVARSFIHPYRPYRYGQAGLAWTEGAWRLEVVRVASDQERPRYRGYPAAEPWVATLLWSF
jgi:uncharacterized protein (TIGR02001 family)